jgi:hypothetical protein
VRKHADMMLKHLVEPAQGDKIPFDVSQGRTITVDTSDVYTVMDKFESARKELGEHLKASLQGNREASSGDNPVLTYLPGIKISLPSPKA